MIPHAMKHHAHQSRLMPTLASMKAPNATPNKP